MSITVLDALNLSVMKEVKLIAGQEGLESPIKWVTIVEVIEDTTRLQEGEFLITTGYGLEADKKRSEQFIQQLKDRKLSAIAIQTGIYMHTIPDYFIKAANKFHLPLFEIPAHLNFSMITKEILQQVVNHQFQTLEYSENIHRQLIDLVLSNFSFQEIANVLAEWTNGNVVIFDPLWNIETYSCLTMNPDQLEIFYHYIYQHLEQSENDRMLIHEKKIVTFTMFYETLAYHCAISPIVGNGEILGFLLMTKLQDITSELDLLALGHASTVCALEFLKKNVVKETEQRLRGDFLEELINEEYTSPTTMKEIAKKLDIHIENPLCVVMMKLEAVTDPDTWNQLRYTVEEQLSRTNKKYLLKMRHTAILLLLEDQNEDKNSIFQAMFPIQTKWNQHFHHRLHIGIGGIVKGLTHISQSAKEAEQAVTYGKVLFEYKEITHYDELGSYHLFIEMINKDFNLHAFYNKIIGPLLEIDNKNKSDLLYTLDTYLYHNMNIQKTSAALFIHRHTLKYRLDKIQKHVAKNIESHNDRLQLQWAIMAYKLSNITESNS